MEPGLRSPWLPGTLAPPENLRKLSLGDCQVFCVERWAGQGCCSCRQELENSSCLTL